MLFSRHGVALTLTASANPSTFNEVLVRESQAALVAMRDDPYRNSPPNLAQDNRFHLDPACDQVTSSAESAGNRWCKSAAQIEHWVTLAFLARLRRSPRYAISGLPVESQLTPQRAFRVRLIRIAHS